MGLGASFLSKYSKVVSNDSLGKDKNNQTKYVDPYEEENIAKSKFDRSKNIPVNRMRFYIEQGEIKL